MAKTKPTGVRFDIEKLSFILSREKLTTNQQVIDFLMNKYWWDNKIPVVTHKEAPPLSLKAETIPTNHKSVEVATRKPKTVDQYIHAKREIELKEDYDKWFQELQSDPFLTDRQKSAAKMA